MAVENSLRTGRQPRGGRTVAGKAKKPVFIDNSVYPTAAEVAKLLKIPAKRLRELEAIVDELFESEK